ncbi:hypothetical protein ABKN59_002787, partial [Abortiporus biennis]
QEPYDEAGKLRRIRSVTMLFCHSHSARR